jgi:hypothetical protein
MNKFIKDNADNIGFIFILITLALATAYVNAETMTYRFENDVAAFVEQAYDADGNLAPVVSPLTELSDGDFIITNPGRVVNQFTYDLETNSLFDWYFFTGSIRYAVTPVDWFKTIGMVAGEEATRVYFNGSAVNTNTDDGTPQVFRVTYEQYILDRDGGPLATTLSSGEYQAFSSSRVQYNFDGAEYQIFTRPETLSGPAQVQVDEPPTWALFILPMLLLVASMGLERVDRVYVRPLFKD